MEGSVSLMRAYRAGAAWVALSGCLGQMPAAASWLVRVFIGVLSELVVPVGFGEIWVGKPKRPPGW